MYGLISGLIAIVVLSSILISACFLGLVYEWGTGEKIKKITLIGFLSCASVMIITLVFTMNNLSEESISALIDKVAITSVLYAPGDEEVTITSDGKTFKFKASECEFVVVGEEAATDNLPYYEWKQKETREVIAIFGHRFYDKPEIQTQYIFYVTEDFLKNLDYEIERVFWVKG